MARTAFLMPLLTLKSNGGGIVAMDLARSIARMGQNITILTSSYHGISAKELPENSDIRFLVVPSIGGKIISTILLLAYGLYYSLKNKPHLIYTHIATSLIPNFSDKKAIWLAQDIEYRFYNGIVRSVFKQILKRIANNSDLLVTSYWLNKYFRRIGGNIIYAKDIGISKKLFKNLLNSKRVHRPNDVLIIAKHGNHKRGHESIALAKHFSDHGLRVILINQMSKKQTLTFNNLSVVGAVTQEKLFEFLTNSKIFLSLSRSEGFGLVPLEALSAGCMVVTTPTPSVYKYESDRLRILLARNSLVDEAIQAVNIFINNPVDQSSEGNGFSEFFLEDWTYYASKSLF